jgi:hypothetical protein
MNGSVSPLSVLGQFLSAGFVLALAGICLALLPLSLPSVREAADPPSVPNPRWVATRMVVNSPTDQGDPHMFIIVVTPARAAQFQEHLLAEASVREVVGEPFRDAEILIAATEAEAVMMAQLIEDQARISGIAPMTAVIAR